MRSPLDLSTFTYEIHVLFEPSTMSRSVPPCFYILSFVAHSALWSSLEAQISDTATARHLFCLDVRCIRSVHLTRVPPRWAMQVLGRPPHFTSSKRIRERAREGERGGGHIATLVILPEILCELPRTVARVSTGFPGQIAETFCLIQKKIEFSYLYLILKEGKEIFLKFARPKLLCQRIFFRCLLSYLPNFRPAGNSWLAHWFSCFKCFPNLKNLCKISLYYCNCLTVLDFVVHFTAEFFYDTFFLLETTVLRVHKVETAS